MSKAELTISSLALTWGLTAGTPVIQGEVVAGLHRAVHMTFRCVLPDRLVEHYPGATRHEGPRQQAARDPAHWVGHWKATLAFMQRGVADFPGKMAVNNPAREHTLQDLTQACIVKAKTELQDLYGADFEILPQSQPHLAPIKTLFRKSKPAQVKEVEELLFTKGMLSRIHHDFSKSRFEGGLRHASDVLSRAEKNQWEVKYSWSNAVITFTKGVAAGDGHHVPNATAIWDKIQDEIERATKHEHQDGN